MSLNPKRKHELCEEIFNNPTYRLGRNFAGVYFCGLPIFCVLRELIFAILDRLVFLSFFFFFLQDVAIINYKK